MFSCVGVHKSFYSEIAIKHSRHIRRWKGGGNRLIRVLETHLTNVAFAGQPATDHRRDITYRCIMENKSESFQKVNSVRPAAPYIGGKRALSKKLVGIIQDTPHTIYAEPFIGMGGVFLRRTLVARSEIINDYKNAVDASELIIRG